MISSIGRIILSLACPMRNRVTSVFKRIQRSQVLWIRSIQEVINNIKTSSWTEKSDPLILSRFYNRISTKNANIRSAVHIDIIQSEKGFTLDVTHLADINSGQSFNWFGQVGHNFQDFWSDLTGTDVALAIGHHYNLLTLGNGSCNFSCNLWNYSQNELRCTTGILNL